MNDATQCPKKSWRTMVTPLAIGLTLLCSGAAEAQNLVWAKRAGELGGESGKDIAVDGSGNSYVTGSFRFSATFGPGETNETTLTSVGGHDIFIAKISDPPPVNFKGSTLFSSHNKPPSLNSHNPFSFLVSCVDRHTFCPACKSCSIETPAYHCSLLQPHLYRFLFFRSSCRGWSA